ncbi:hypothetical protein EMPS_07398 [Entomortierella parvispora]|uniref:Hamartin n=1 Tax=Entomortierella parvispora TaxID=205924 RepID=A0A9P3LYN4_9FUNG|nr:hypothetical protein EMPS_07398 [Entomortierella parvispora]
MSSSAPTVKDLYRVLTADFNASVTADKAKDTEAPRETIQHYLDRFVKSVTASSGNSQTPSTPSSANAASHSSASFLAGTTGSGGPAPSSGPAAAGRRHANELWYQSLTNSAHQQHTSNLPFAFHRLSRQSSVVASPANSGPSSLSGSATGSPILSSTTATQPHTTGSGNTGAPSSPSVQPTSTSFSISSTAPNANLAAQRFSAHLVGLYTQHGLGAVPIAAVASRMIIYLTHLLPFLTPQLVMADWWDRLLEPSLQGEIKLDKDTLKACRELVTECMIKDPLLDPQGSGSGSLLLAGDEEGQLETSLAMTAMPIAQFVLRVYIKAAHKLNHRLDDMDAAYLQSAGDGLQGSWLRSKERPNPSAHPGPLLSFTSAASASTTQSQSSVQKDLETQQRLFSKARALIRRKKDILVKNLETILFAYGGGVGRVKDFFSCLYTYFVGARYRAEILGLLCQFIRRQRVHLHQILATPLFDSLVLSLKYDTSPLIVSLGLMTLIMMMPRIPTALNDRLPELFAVLARILCWPRSRQQLMAVTQQEGANLTGQTIKSFDEFDEDSAKATSGAGANQDEKASGSPSSNGEIEYQDIPLYQHGIRWRRYGPAVPGGTSEGAPDPTAIFSFLYGLFPCNLLKFLNAPRIYLAQSLSPTGSPKLGSGHNSEDGEGADGGMVSPKEGSAEQKALYIDEDLLKSRVKTLLKRHSLHPALLTQTAEQEITDKARWQKLEPMEIVAMCVGLDIWSAGGLSGTGPILRSIEEDKRGVPVVDSDDDDDDDDDHVTFSGTGHRLLARSTSVKASDSSDADVRPVKSSSNRLTQAAAGASVESLGSEESADLTPIEILAQEDFFGPRAGVDTGARPLHSGSSAGFASSISAPSLPRARVRSKEVRMSQILRNFATLRGLDQDDYLQEVDQRKTFGSSGITSGQRRASAQKQATHDLYSHPVAATSSSSVDIVTPDIPATEEQQLTVATTSSSEMAVQASAATLEAISTMHQEYRKSIAQLERELLMAKNELNFELFLKQQHIQQISKVHQSHVLDASLEAERQNLYNTCRSLKAQLQETRVLLEKEKAELTQRKNKQTHWDTELKAKMQTFRDERKQLQFEVERLKQDINDTRQAQETQERLLTEERKGTFDLQNEIQDLSPKLKRMEEYEKRIEELTRQMVLWETEQSKSLEVQRQMDAVVGRWQNLELLLISEKEESRVLRNKVSQQSQILDDLRIQLAMSEGRAPGVMPSTPTIEFQSEDESHNHAIDNERDQDDGVDGSRGDEGDNDDTEDDHHSRLVRRASSRSKATSLRRRSGDGSRRPSDIGWPSTFSRSSSNQTGFEQQRRAEAVQELMIREKERWDQELQQAHNRLSREAVRNQQLEDRILELQGQLEMARAIDMRNMPGFGGGHGGGLGHGGGGGPGGGNGGIGNIEHDPEVHMEGPSQPVHFPHAPSGNDGIMRSHLDLHHHDGSTEGGDTDDGGSTGMIGRYSQRHRDDDEDGYSDPRMRSMGQHPHDQQPFESYHGSENIPPRPPGYPSQVGSMSSSSRLFGKGKSTSSSNLSSVKGSKSRSKWLQTPTTLERAQADSGTFGGILNIGPNTHLGAGSGTYRKSGESFSTVGSSSTATRATSGGLYPPMTYTRNMSHRSDGGSSDVTTASDSSATGRQRVLRGRAIARPLSDSELSHDLEAKGRGEAGGSTPGGSRSGSRSGSAASGSTSGGGSKKSGRSKEDREHRDRERDKIRLMGTMGPLVDPSKMYRNVRMF